MPRLDGTGPNGQGCFSGKGIRKCVERNSQPYGVRMSGRLVGRTFGNCYFRGGRQNIQEANIDSLNARASYLKNELDNINKVIDSLKNL